MDILPVPAKNKFPMICHKLHPVFAQIAFCKPVVLTKTVGTVQIIFFQQLFTEDEDVYKRQEVGYSACLLDKKWRVCMLF